MKILMAILVVVVLDGCVTAQHEVRPPLGEYDLQQARMYYDSLDVASATPVEAYLIGQDWDQSVAKRNCKDFPWLNPRSLSAKDKLFILRMKNDQKPSRWRQELQPLMGQP